MLSLAACELWLINDAGRIGRGGEPGEGKTKTKYSIFKLKVYPFQGHLPPLTLRRTLCEFCDSPKFSAMLHSAQLCSKVAIFVHFAPQRTIQPTKQGDAIKEDETMVGSILKNHYTEEDPSLPIFS